VKGVDVSRDRFLAIVAALVLGGGLIFGGLDARAESDPTINGCFDNSTGQLRVLTPSADKCVSGTETPLSWNGNQLATRWWRDNDGDGQGDWYLFVDSPAQPPGYVSNNDDCDDNNPDAYKGRSSDPGPGDLDCNGRLAQDQLMTYYRDADGDGFGDTNSSVQAPLTSPPKGYVLHYDDCNDANANVHPYHLSWHRRTNGTRYQAYDCPLNGSGTDLDGDGHRSPLVGGDDCDDFDSHEYPGNTEVRDGYGHDEDCDPTTGGIITYNARFLDERANHEGTLPGIDPLWATPPDYLTGRDGGMCQNTLIGGRYVPGCAYTG
jgi:hypothetical protein